LVDRDDALFVNGSGFDISNVLMKDEEYCLTPHKPKKNNYRRPGGAIEGPNHRLVNDRTVAMAYAGNGQTPKRSMTSS
jgi:hypothetical protein